MRSEVDAASGGSGKADVSERTEKNYTYILKCADGTLYTGWTNDLAHRVETHNAGCGGKYTRSRLPVTLVYAETFSTRHEAMSREYAIKKLSRKEKLQLIRESHQACASSQLRSPS